MPRRKRSVSESFSDLYDDDSSENGQPIQRNAANARERARMRVLSSAFCRLKTKLPWVPADTKLSKLDTLRLAKGYIQQLEAILAGQPIDDNLQIATGQHHNLSWPFIFQSGDPATIKMMSSPEQQQHNGNHNINNNSSHVLQFNHRTANGHPTADMQSLYPNSMERPSFVLTQQNQFYHASALS